MSQDGDSSGSSLPAGKSPDGSPAGPWHGLVRGAGAFLIFGIVVLVGVTGVLLPTSGNTKLVAWGLPVLTLVYLLGLSLGAKLNARRGEHAFKRRIFDRRHVLEQQLGSLMPEAASATALDEAVVTRVEDYLHSARTNGTPATRAEIVSLMARTLGIPVVSNAAEIGQYYDRINAVLDNLQKRIESEYDDTHTRTGWLMTSQAILLSSFVALVNLDKLEGLFRDSLLIALAALGALVAVVLSFAIFHGHALIVSLKVAREDVEKITADEYGLPRMGVQSGSPVHLYGHLATKVLPSVAFVGWSILLGTSMFQKTLLRTTPAAGAQMIAVPASPAFQWSESDFGMPADRQRQPCIDTGSPTPEKWAHDVVATWRGRPAKSHRDGILLVGSTDRSQLGPEGLRRYGSDAGLARARLTTAANLLVSAAGEMDLEGTDVLSEERIFLQVTGPSYTPPEGTSRGDPGCANPTLIADRKVLAWIIIR